MDFDLLEKEIIEFEKKALENFDLGIIENKTENDQALFFLKTYHFYINFVIKKLNKNFDKGDSLFVSKLATDVLAIYACLSYGVKNQAILIIRSLVESSAMYELIQRDRKVLMPLYLDHEHYLRGKYLNNEKDPSKLPSWVDQNKIKAEYIKVKKNYIGNYWYGKYLQQKGISKPTIFEVFKLVNREFDYNTIYRSFSNFSHSSSITNPSFRTNEGYTTTYSFDKKDIIRFVLLTIGSANKTLKSLPTTTQSEKDIIAYSDNYYGRLNFSLDNS